MKILSVIMIILTCLTAAVSSTWAADLFDNASGGRPLAMGRTFTAFSGDVNAAFFNPAGIANIPSPSFMTKYSSAFTDVNDLTVAAAFPTQTGVWGLGYVANVTGNIPIAGLVNGVVVQVGTGSITDSVMFLGYGYRTGQFSLGTNLKYFVYDAQNIGTTQGNARGFDMDIGMLYTYSDQIALGLSYRNALSKEMGGKKTWGTGYEEDIPSVAKAGVDLNYDPVKVGVDMDLRLRDDGLNPIHAGVEWKALKILSLRIGLDQKLTSAGVAGQIKTITQTSLGVGFSYSGLDIDYAFRPDFNQDGEAKHFLSLSYSM